MRVSCSSRGSEHGGKGLESGRVVSHAVTVLELQSQLGDCFVTLVGLKCCAVPCCDIQDVGEVTMPRSTALGT